MEASKNSPSHDEWLIWFLSKIAALSYLRHFYVIDVLVLHRYHISSCMYIYIYIPIGNLMINPLDFQFMAEVSFFSISWGKLG